MRYYIVAFLFAVVTLVNGCGGYIAPSTVNAQSHDDNISCGASGDGDGYACTFTKHILDADGKELFYCTGETHIFPATKTYSVHVEIGVSKLITNPNISGCNVPLPLSTKWSSIRGNVGLTPFTSNLTSIATWFYAIDNGHKAVLLPGKITANNRQPTNTALQDCESALRVTRNVDSILVWFNIDLPDSVPATIHMSAVGEIL